MKTHLLTWIQQLVATIPATTWPLQHFYTACIVLLVLLAAVSMFRLLNQALREALGGFAWTMFLIGLPLWFFRYQGIPLLGMDLWLLIWLITGIIWLLTLLISQRAQAAAQAREQVLKDYKSKYLPKQK